MASPEAERLNESISRFRGTLSTVRRHGGTIPADTADRVQAACDAFDTLTEQSIDLHRAGRPGCDHSRPVTLPPLRERKGSKNPEADPLSDQLYRFMVAAKMGHACGVLPNPQTDTLVTLAVLAIRRAERHVLEAPGPVLE